MVDEETVMRPGMAKEQMDIIVAGLASAG